MVNTTYFDGWFIEDDNATSNNSKIKLVRNSQGIITNLVYDKKLLDESISKTNKKINMKKCSNSTLLFEIYRVLSQYSSKNRRLSCNEIINEIENHGYDIRNSYEESSIPNTIKREIKKLNNANIHIDNLNGDYYMVNNACEFINDERVYAMVDMLNRAPTFNELYRYLTISYLSHNYNLENISKYMSLVLYSKYHASDVNIEAKFIPIIQEAITKEQNLSITLVSEKNIIISPYYFAICNDVYYCVASKVKSTYHKLTIFKLNEIKNISVVRSSFIDFTQIYNIQNLASELIPDIDLNDLDKEKINICGTFLLRATVGDFINVQFKVKSNTITSKDIYNTFGPMTKFNRNMVTVERIPEKIFIEWAINNSDKIKYIKNLELTKKINDKIESICILPENECKSVIALYIDIKNDDVKVIETLEKFGILSIKSGTTPIFTLYKRHKDSFMYYVFSNPDKISLSKSNLNADNEETKLLYKEFLRFVNESYTAYRNNK